MDCKKYITVIGGSNVDITGLPGGQFRAGDSNPGSIGITAGGVGRNIAENTARLEINTVLLTAFGDDSFGDFLLKKCSEAGISTKHAERVLERSSSVYTAIMDENGELRAAVSDMGIIEAISPQYILKNKILIQNAEIVVADNNISAESLKMLIRLSEGRLLFDAVSGEKLKKRADIIHNIDTVKLNSIEAGILAGIPVKTPEDAMKASEIISKRGIRNIFITLGAEGALYVCEAEHWFVIPKKVASVNTTGCGDAFTAGIAYGIINNLTGEQLLSCAAACASIAAESPLTVAEQLCPKLLKKILEGE